MAPRRRPSNSELVYSTDDPPPSRAGTGRKAQAPARAAPPQDGVVRVGRETKGRKGKGVTLITGAPLDAAGLQGLAKELKNLCGAGGTLKGDVIEIQGDHRERIVPALEARGWTVKRAGG